MLHYDGKLYIGVKLGVVCCCLLDKARRTKSLPFSRVRDFFHFLARNAPYKNTCVTSVTGSHVEVGSVYALLVFVRAFLISSVGSEKLFHARYEKRPYKHK